MLLLVQAVHPGALPPSLVTDPLTLVQHLQLALKSAIVAASWVFTYFALKHLPLSIGSPIRATSPLFTLFGAILILGERPTVARNPRRAHHPGVRSLDSRLPDAARACIFIATNGSAS